jgi:PAS domain-containing protein
MSDEKTETISFSSEDEVLDLAEIRNLNNLSTETIDLTSLFADEVSPTGSFDLRQFRVTSFGRLLEAIPIPTLLVDEACQISFANRACNRAAGEPARIEGNRFSTLFPNHADGQRAEKLVERVFHDRIPLITEGTIGLDELRMHGRIHLRSLRIQRIRTILVIIEDISPWTRLPGKTPER